MKELLTVQLNSGVLTNGARCPDVDGSGAVE